MNKKTHTPGPWHCDDVHPDNGCIMIGSAKDYICVMRPYPDDEAFNSGDTEENERQTKANARLIAAAPALLEALCGLIVLRDREDVADTFGPELDAAEAAIAKAEGRA